MRANSTPKSGSAQYLAGSLKLGRSKETYFGALDSLGIGFQRESNRVVFLQFTAVENLGSHLPSFVQLVYGDQFRGCPARP